MRLLRWCLLLATLVFLTATVRAQETITDAAAGLKLTLPSGWHARDFPGLKYKVAITTPIHGFAPNITIVDEAFAGSAADYARASQPAFDHLTEQTKVIGESHFVLESGKSAEKIVMENTYQKGKALRQTFYLVPGEKGRMFTFTFTMPVGQGSQYDKVVDKAIRGVVIGSH